MILYRFANEKYCGDISGEGARLHGGRWNSPGFPVLYASNLISLSLLELFIHSVTYAELKSNKLVCIETPDRSIQEINPATLKKDWHTDIDYSRFIGNEFIKSSSSLLLKVPSAIIPEEHNILVNPRHKDFLKVKVHEIRDFSFDARFFK